MEVDVRQYDDDLEMALALMTNISELFDRLEDKQKTLVLQIIIKRIVIDPDGNIIFLKLHSPFSYLSTLFGGLNPFKKERESSFRFLDSQKLSTEEGGRIFDKFSESVIY